MPGPAVRVLIAEDEEVFANALRLWLEARSGIEVVAVAHTGPEAVDFALVHDPEVVLMDIGLPGFDGLEATRRLLASNPNIKVIALTGQTADEGAAAAIEAGAAAFLTKGNVHDVVEEAILRSVDRPLH